MNKPLHGDGLLENLFYYLWVISPDEKPLRVISIPDTVIYRYSQPRAWYFTSRQGFIKRKSKVKLTASSIESVFLKNISASGIVASYTYMETINGPRIIEYLGPQELKHFLSLRKKTQDGILQKFIEPKSNKNTTVQCIWSPSILLCDMRENLKDLYELKYDMYERAVTYEGEEFHSNLVNIKGKEFKNYVQTQVCKIVEHIGKVSNGNIRISRIVLQFKTDFNDTLWLLRAISIRDSEIKSAEPIDLNFSTQLPNTVSMQGVSMNPHNPLMLQMNVICRNCDKAQVSQNMHEVRYNYILNSSRSNQIPTLIAKLHPMLSQKDFRTQRTNPVFLNNRCLVCEGCYLIITEEMSLQYERLSAVLDKQKLIPIRGLDPTHINRRREITRLSNITQLSSTLLPIRSRSQESLSLLKGVGQKNSMYETGFPKIFEKLKSFKFDKMNTSRETKGEELETNCETER